MIGPQTDIQQDVDRVEISDTLIDLIVDKMVDEMNDRIAKINPSDDPSAEYGEYWTSGSYDSDDYLELDEPNDEYCISYRFELSWEYRTWTEYWTDPVCYPSFDDMRNETGYIYDIEIDTPDGDAVKQCICDAIAKKVNNKIK